MIRQKVKCLAICEKKIMQSNKHDLTRHSGPRFIITVPQVLKKTKTEVKETEILTKHHFFCDNFMPVIRNSKYEGSHNVICMHNLQNPQRSTFGTILFQQQ